MPVHFKIYCIVLRASEALVAGLHRRVHRRLLQMRFRHQIWSGCAAIQAAP